VSRAQIQRLQLPRILLLYDQMRDHVMSQNWRPADSHWDPAPHYAARWRSPPHLPAYAASQAIAWAREV